MNYFITGNILIGEGFSVLGCLIWDNDITRVRFETCTSNWVKIENQDVGNMFIGVYEKP